MTGTRRASTSNNNETARSAAELAGYYTKRLGTLRGVARQIEAVVFDIGETLVDETRLLGRWADWLNIPRLTFFAVLGARIARGEPTSGFLDPFNPPFDPQEELRRRRRMGDAQDSDASDLYADVIPSLLALRERGLRIGAAGNQPKETHAWLAALEPSLDLVGISEIWGIRKPNPAFFARICEELELPPQAIAYVGDRIDNDVIPARAAGMLDIHIRRGPFGYVMESDVVPAHSIASLAELPGLLAAEPPN
jgi:FMN phosphatase YigB (HAD superfamily)